jgi:hypothetical protein
MKLPPRLAYRLSPLVEAARGEPLLEPSLELAAADEARIVLHSEQGVFTFDRLQRRVAHDGAEVATFDEVRSVDINAFPGGRGAPSWGLSLYCSFTRRVPLGRTYDDGNASVLAARLARALGCKVVAVALKR